MKVQLKETSDGSHTLYVPEINEHYHSFHGAIQEAQHVFIKHGFDKLHKSPASILEVGFGTGLNALLTACKSYNKKIQIDYVGIESNPVDLDLMQKLNYPEQIKEEEVSSFFFKIFESAWEVKHQVHPFFNISKFESKIQNYKTGEKFDLIYFDAFGPKVQSEMWSIDILGKMFDVLKPGGFLVTYCAKGQFKRDLKSLGFEVTSLEGPPGKREMVSAKKKAVNLKKIVGQ